MRVFYERKLVFMGKVLDSLFCSYSLNSSFVIPAKAGIQIPPVFIFFREKVPRTGLQIITLHLIGILPFSDETSRGSNDLKDQKASDYFPEHPEKCKPP